MKFTSLLCQFGYSLISYLPATIVTIFTRGIISYLIFLIAFSHQTWFIYQDYWPIFQDKAPAHALIIIGGIAIINFFIATFIKLYFFY